MVLVGVIGIAFSRLSGFGLGYREGAWVGGGGSSSASPFRDPSGVQWPCVAVWASLEVGNGGLGWGVGGVLGAGTGDDSNPN